MKKQSRSSKVTNRITNLLVLPLVAYAIFLASPALADASSAGRPALESTMQTRHRMSQGGGMNMRKGVVGTVSSVDGSVIKVTTKDGTEYTIDASHATVMKDGGGGEKNPNIVSINDIKVGDFIMVRGTVSDDEVEAEKIFDGKMQHGRNFKGMKKGGSHF